MTTENNLPPCIQCGGTEYINEVGLFFCVECHMQCEGAQEQVNEATELEILTQTVKVARNVEGETLTAAVDEEELTSWETLNFVLKGLVDEIILLGAPEELKYVALQLWCSYLKKIEVAFISKRCKRSKLGPIFKQRDAKIMYQATPEEIGTKRLTLKRKLHKKSISGSSFDAESTTTIRSLNRSKKKLAKLLHAESLPQQSQKCGSEISLDISTDKQTGHSIKYSTLAKTALRIFAHSLDGCEDKKIIHRRFLKAQSLSNTNTTVIKLISIIKLALQILGITIHNGDIIRWCDEGSVSILTAEKFIPHGKIIAGDNKHLFINRLNSRSRMALSFYRTAEFLDAYKKPCIVSLVARFIDELDLPDDVRIITDLLVVIDEPQLTLTSNMNVEGRAIALIIFSLKLLFGIDDVTENNLSIFAQSINRNAEVVKQEGEQFVWTDWMKHIVRRGAFVSKVHQPTRYRLYKNSSIGGANPFILQWNRLHIKQSYERDGNMKKDLCEAIQRMLNNFVDPLEEPNSRPYKSRFLSNIYKRDSRDINSKSLMYLIDRKFRRKMIKQLGFIETEKLCREFEILSGLAKRQRSKIYKVYESSKFKLHLIDSDDESNFSYSTNCNNTALYGFPNEANNVYKAGGLVWLFHDNFKRDKISEGEFLDFARNSLSTNFVWLLKECSLLIGQSLRDIYEELVTVERNYLFHVTNIKKRHKLCRSW